MSRLHPSNALGRRSLLLAPIAGVLLLAVSARADVGPGEAPASDEYAEELQGYVPGASVLEGRIMAPCCWQQTIDIHGSEVSQALRREIRRRLRSGEASAAIEQSLVERYGSRILAVPPGSALKSVAVFLSLSMLGAGVGAVMLLRRWKERGGEPQKAKSEKGSGSSGKAASDADRADYEARLDAELRAMDE